MRLPKPAARSIAALGRVWVHPSADHQYHPLVDTVFWIEARLFNQRMSGYHFANILLHAMAAFLLLKILRQLAIPGACLATTLFALHPLQVESVAWLAEMKNTLSAVFLFAALLTYLHYDRERIQKWYWLTWLFFVVGLFAKASTAYLPICVLIIEWWRRGKLGWRRDVRPMLPFFAAGTFSALATFWFERRIGAATGTIAIAPIDRFLIAGRAFWFYLGKIFWPINLKMFYPRWAIDPGAWWQYLFPAAAALLLLATWWLRRRYRWQWAGLLFFFLSLVPFLGFFNVRMFRFQFVSEHLEYLPIIGIIVPVSAGIAITLNRWHGCRRLIWTMPVAIAVVALTIQTWQHSKAFRDAETCYRDSLANGGENWIAHMNLGIILIAHGQPADAQVHLRRALELNPPEVASVAGIHVDLGQALREKRQLDEAIEEFRKSIDLWPDFRAYNALASILHQQGNVREAIANYRKAMELAPQSPVAMANTAWILATASDDSLRNGSQALELALKADKLSGGVDPFTIHALAAAYAETGNYSKAIETGRRALVFATQRQLPDLANQLRSDVALYVMNLPVREAAK
jgi:tetratricopeptide (TPR) repeat protein